LSRPPPRKSIEIDSANRRVRPEFLIALIAVVTIFAVNLVYISHQVPVVRPEPTSGPTIPPLFTIDYVDLGQRVHLTRFVPDFDVYWGNAVEGADSRLYVAYYPNRPPRDWGFTGGEASRIGILENGHMHPILVSRDKELNSQSPPAGSIQLEGLDDGMPVIKVREEYRERLVVVGTHGVTTIRSLSGRLQGLSPCIPFAGGRICNDDRPYDFAVSVAIPGQPYAVIHGAGYSVDRFSIANNIRHDSFGWETGDVELIGGGRHSFLLCENHGGQELGECLEGSAP
jgi:hypothetical protein